MDIDNTSTNTIVSVHYVYKDLSMTNWNKKWVILTSNLGGGQSECFIVHSVDNKDKPYFLKQLKDQDDSERRSRFFVETTIYKSVQIEGIPKIIETNSELFKEKGIPLYYVSDFIEGIRLDNFVKQAALTENQVIGLFKQLLIILNECHSQDVVHRDIKPENIIINVGKLYLVDFGISYYKTDTHDNITKLGQEIGNRFLRLPEHSAGSPNKRDIRSDITLAAGIALFMITAEYPRRLVDENGRFPHQTEKSRALINSYKFSKFWNLLFDKGFMQNLANRWNSSNDILKIINAMTEESESSDRYEELLQLHAEQIDQSGLKELDEGLKKVHFKLERIHIQILETKAKGFENEKQGSVYTRGETETRSLIRSFPIGTKRDNFVGVLLKARLVGEQVVGLIELEKTEYEMVRVSFGEPIPENEIDSITKEMEKRVLPALTRKLT